VLVSFVIFPAKMMKAAGAHQESPAVPGKPGMLEIEIVVNDDVLTMMKRFEIALHAGRINERVGVGTVYSE
jgi:hypothetical protein